MYDGLKFGHLLCPSRNLDFASVLVLGPHPTHDLKKIKGGVPKTCTWPTLDSYEYEPCIGCRT